MDPHFRAFSFVDRIDAIGGAGPIRGHYQVPAGIGEFPVSLVGEAVGQLAAWGVMSAVRFERRPVAGIAGKVEFLAPVRPGARLDLEAVLQSSDGEAAAYHGHAEVDGVPVLRLHDCLGPMLPAAEFDDPAALVDRFTLLTGPGVGPGGFAGLPPLVNEPVASDWPVRRARFSVPGSALLFADHFPRRPVFPGSLIMHQGLDLVRLLAGDAPAPAGGAWRPVALSGLKLRAFVEPGAPLDLEARWMNATAEVAEATLEVRRDGARIGGARAWFAPGSGS